jgi:hypothetical protein
LAAAGEVYSLALKTNGTLWAWGANTMAQLGTGNYDDVFAPVQIGSDADWVTIAAGGDLDSGGGHSLALKADGTLWAWGGNSKGELGTGNYDEKTKPEKIGSDTDWKSVSAGWAHSLALKTDGTLWAWGYNEFGQLGTGDYVDITSPVQIGSDTDWASIDAGEIHSIAQKADGTIWAWGSNNSGILGTGDANDRSTPSPVTYAKLPAILTLSFDPSGTGSGTITEPNLGISCGSNCFSDQMMIGVAYLFTATPSQYAYLYSLIGPNCSMVNGTCAFTPTGDITIIARFDLDTAHQVYIPASNNTGSYYSSLQAAYNSADPGSTVMTWAQDYSENLNCSIIKAVTLKGGYNQGYTAVTNWTALHGTLTIERGALTIEGIAIL